MAGGWCSGTMRGYRGVRSVSERCIVSYRIVSWRNCREGRLVVEAKEMKSRHRRHHERGERRGEEWTTLKHVDVLKQNNVFQVKTTLLSIYVYQKPAPSTANAN